MPFFELVEHMKDGTKVVLATVEAKTFRDAYQQLSRKLLWQWSSMSRTIELIELEPEDSIGLPDELL